MILRRMLRHGADLAALLLGALHRRERRAAGGLTILMYHRVLPDAACADYPLPALALPESAFADQVRWLARRARVLPVREALDAPPEGGRPLVAITLDDGFADNAEIAAPILERAGLRASFYLTAGLIGTTDLLWFDELALQLLARSNEEVTRAVEAAELPGDGPPRARIRRAPIAGKRRLLETLRTEHGAPPGAERHRLMSWDDARRLARAGHEVASHTMTHPLLPELGDATLDFELTESRRRLAAELGEPVGGFCYPGGAHDDRVVERTRAAGYDYALTTLGGLNPAAPADRFRLLRRGIKTVRVAGGTGRPSVLAFRGEAFGYHDRLRGASQERRWEAGYS